MKIEIKSAVQHHREELYKTIDAILAHSDALEASLLDSVIHVKALLAEVERLKSENAKLAYEHGDACLGWAKEIAKMKTAEEEKNRAEAAEAQLAQARKRVEELAPTEVQAKESQAKQKLFEYFLYSKPTGHGCSEIIRENYGPEHPMAGDCPYCYYGRMTEEKRRDIGHALQNEWADARQAALAKLAPAENQEAK